MRRFKGIRRAIVVAGASTLALAFALPVSADPDSGSVTVRATNNAAITLSVSDGTADFGTNLDPLGTNSNSSDFNQVQDFQEANGSYYVWKSNGGGGLVVTVKSNKSWTGGVAASPNTGSSASMSIDSGVLRYTESAPSNYWDAALATAFTNRESGFEAAGTKGVHTYNHFYALRVNWEDDPGTFASSVTYSATH